jgi:hypothetical protein
MKQAECNETNNENKSKNCENSSTTQNDCVASSPIDFEIRQIEEEKFLNLERLDLLGISNIFDSYATKKTYATGFINLALIATNFTQLKHLLALNYPNFSFTNIIVLACVIISLFMQVVVGIVLVYLAKHGEFFDAQKRSQLIRKNNMVTLMILAISIINVFINVFINV